MAGQRLAAVLSGEPGGYLVSELDNS